VSVTADQTHNISVAVTATNSSGSRSATSATVGPLSATVGTCSNSQSFFTRASTNMTAAGGPSVTSTWAGAVDGLVCGQVSGGTFSLKDVEYFLVAPTVALADMNLVSSSFTLAPQASVTFAANLGMTGAANTTGYADTTYHPTSGQMTTSSSLMGVCVLNNRTTLATPSFQSELGSDGPSNGYVLDPLSGSTTSAATLFGLGGTGSASFSTTTIPTTQGGFWASRTTSGSLNSYLSGTNLGAFSSTAPSLTGTPSFFVFAFNNNGTMFGTAALPDTVGAVILGAGETTAQVQADEALFTAALHTVGIGSGC
jgi:hypothetical protein